MLNFICVELFLKEGAHLLCFLFIVFLLPHLSLLLRDQVVENLQGGKGNSFVSCFRPTIFFIHCTGLPQIIFLSSFLSLSVDLISCVCTGHHNPEQREGHDSLPQLDVAVHEHVEHPAVSDH